MSYIGRGIDSIDNISTLDNLSFNGSDATFNLTQNSVAFVPVSADALQIQIDGVIQSGNYTVSGSTVTFDFVPSGSSVCNGIRHFGVGLLTTVSDSSITTAKLGADSVNGSKIADDSISDEHLDITAITGQTEKTSLADADKFLISDSAASGALKYVQKSNLPSGKMVLLQSASTQTNTGAINFENLFDKNKYSFYRLVGWFRPVTDGSDLNFRWRSATDALSAAEYYGVVQGKTVDGGGTSDLIWSRWGGTFAKITNDAGNNAYNGLIIDMVLRPRFASGTSTVNSANITFQGGYWQNNGGSERALSMHGHYTYTNSSADMDNGGFLLYPSSGDFDEFEYVLYGITQS